MGNKLLRMLSRSERCSVNRETEKTRFCLSDIAITYHLPGCCLQTGVTGQSGGIGVCLQQFLSLSVPSEKAEGNNILVVYE